MATLISVQNHNFTAAAWGTSNSTAQNISQAANTTLTTSYVTSSTFTPGAITIDGIAVFVNTRLGATGTISVALDQAGATVAGTEVTINVVDIPAAGKCWVFFKFPAPVLLVAATAYGVKAKTSSATQVNLYSSATTNWSRMLRTTTLAAPAAADVLYIIGERTGAGTGNTSTVTMNNTAATIFGTTNIESNGKLVYGLAAATAYLLKLAGNLVIRSGGEVNIGTTSSRMPVDSVGELFFSNSVNVDFGLILDGSGIIRTGGFHKESWALLAADASGGATSLTTNISTGWKNGDTIGIASTTRTSTQTETKALTADAVGTALTIAALANAHSGGGATNGPDVVAELVNLTRNVKIHGTSSSLQAYILTGSTLANTVCDFNDTEFYFLGSNTNGARGIQVPTVSPGTFQMSYCALRDFVVSGAVGVFFDTAGSTGLTLSQCVFYGIQSVAISMSTPTGTNAVVADNCVVLATLGGSSNGVSLSANNGFTNSRIAGCPNDGLLMSGGTATFGTIDNIIIHSNAGDGLEFPNGVNALSVLTNITSYRNNTSGIYLNHQTTPGPTITGFTLFGNNNRGIFHNAARGYSLFNGVIRAGLVLTQAAGVEINNGFVANAYFGNCVFGGSSQPHATADVYLPSSSTTSFNFVLDYCILNSAAQISVPANLLNLSGPAIGQPSIRANFLGQTVAHKSWFNMGTWTYDTVIKDGGAASLRMTPTSATIKLASPYFYKSAATGVALSVSIKVRKSVSGDGAAYNGNQPRFVLRRNYGGGILADTVLATSTVAGDGAFETLSVIITAVTNDCVLELYVDCDGTTGWVNVDNLLITPV